MFNILISLYINHLFTYCLRSNASLRFPWIPLTLPCIIRTPFPWNPWHGMSWLPLNAMEEVEFYRIPRKPWNLIWLRIDLNCWENGRWNLHFKKISGIFCWQPFCWPNSMDFHCLDPLTNFVRVPIFCIPWNSMAFHWNAMEFHWNAMKLM